VEAVTQREVELILMRQVASYLALPIFIVDPGGTLIYYNEPAEGLLGCRYDEQGEMPVEVWSTVFVPKDDKGDPLPAEELPLVRALAEKRPAHGRMVIDGMDGRRRTLDVTGLPLIGQSGRELGALAVFWEVT
jgi:PAS domain-containing protein